MSSFMRMLLATMACISVVAQPADAAPTRVGVMPNRPAAIAVGRSRGPAAFKLGAVPVFAAVMKMHRTPGPVRALPVPMMSHSFTAGFAALRPRLGVAALLAPGSAKCSTVRRRVLIEAVPTTPFVTDDCATRNLQDEGRPATSLVAGHDKNALYGRAYAPSAGEPR